MKKLANDLRRAMLAAASNVSLFVTAAFFVTGLLVLGPQVWYREYIDMLERYILIPWGMALSLLRLYKRTQRGEEAIRWEICVLFVLLGWVIVPFALRFGNTFNNSGSWHNHTVLFFGIYALTAEESAQGRERLFDLAALLFSLCSLLLAGALLYCVWTFRVFGVDTVNSGFGVCEGMYLCANVHYNTTGMIAVCCALMSLAAFCRMKHWPLRASALLAVIMMSAVAVLTQSRTARYVLIAAYGAGLYGLLAANLRWRSALVRHAAGLLAAVMVMVGGYVGADALSDAALKHYKNARAAIKASMAAETQTQDEAQATAKRSEEKTEDPRDTTVKAEKQKEKKQPAIKERKAVDASFSGRTAIWRNLFSHWKENPKYLFIGHGVGRIGAMVLENTIHEGREGVAIHNTYLQFIADFGLIGFVLLCAFFALILPPVLRVFFARGGAQAPGYRALCMLVLTALLTGMMESAPLGAMTPMNMMLFFALALLAARGRDLPSLVKEDEPVV